MNTAKIHIKKGDNVIVLSGKEKGKKGKVLHISRETSRAIVEALNMVTHHERPSRRNAQGGIVRREGPIHVSNLLPICAKCGKPTRVGKKILEDGSRVRVCKKCSEIIDLG